MPRPHECPTRLHEDDRIVLVEGLVVFRLGGLVWLLGFLVVGTFVALLPPAWFRGLPFLPADGEPPLLARVVVFAVFAALGVFLSKWRPAGLDPLSYGLIRARHALTPTDTVWHPVDVYAPPVVARAIEDGDRAGQSEEYQWSE